MTSVLVTGCSSGIGAAIATRLAQAGWPVYATARRPDMLDTLREGGARTLALDVTNEDSMRSAVAVVERDHGSVGALVNNAGFGQSGALEEVPIDALRRQFDTNVFGLLRLTQLVLPGMRRARQGRIVNVGSMGGRLTFPGGGAYQATKHGLVALNEALRVEVRGFGDVALASLDRLERPQSPYAHFNREVGRITTESYEKGPVARLSGSPEDVAVVVEEALKAGRPKTRYQVSSSARVFLTLRRLLSDRMWDAFLRRTYLSPGAESD